MQIECGACHEEMFAPDPKPPQIVNTAGVSILVLEHHEQMTCPKCGRALALFLTGANLMLIGQPVQARATNRLIVAPPGAVRRA